MKTLTLMTAILMGSQLSWASLHVEFALKNQSNFPIPASVSTSGQTKTIEWGCPIDQEHREEPSRKMTLKSLVSECVEQVSQAATRKPNVAGVLRTSVISPDVTFRELPDGTRIVNGTIFLQTVVAMTGAAQ